MEQEEQEKELVKKRLEDQLNSLPAPNKLKKLRSHTTVLDEPGCLDDLNQDSHQKTTGFVTGINLAKNIIGIGILTLPYAFTYAGWLGGTIILVFVGYLAVYCCWVLMDLANQKKVELAAKGIDFDPRNYQEFIEQVCQSRGITYIINILIFGGQLSDLIASCMFFTLYFQESFCFWEMEEFCESRIPALTISLCIIFPLSFIRQLKSFKTYSLYGLLIVLVSSLFIMYQGRVHIDQYPINWDELAFLNVEQFPLSIGIYAAAYEAFAVYFDLRHSMKEPEQFTTVFLNVTHLINIIYICVGAGGYIMFGKMTKDVILFNLPMSNYFFVFIVFIYCIQLAITYSMHLFPLVVIAEMACEDRGDVYGEAKFLYEQAEQEDQQDQQQEQEQEYQGVVKLIQNEGEKLSHKMSDEQHQQNLSEIRKKQESNDNDNDDLQDDHQGPENDAAEDIEEQFAQRPLEWHSVFIRIGYTAFIFSVTLVFKQVSLFFGFFGAACGIPMMFIVPLLIWEYKSKVKPFWMRVINWLVIVLAGFNMILGMYQNGFEIYENFHFSL